MKNIREEKGYTYGVGSAWLTMKYDGLFVVQTDVGNQYIHSTLEEIRKEMLLLIDKGLPLSELDLVRNYMLGKSATGRETPSQLLGLIQNALINDFSFEEIDRKHDIIMALTPADIQRLAAQYLQPDQLLEVVCGKM
jgi:predicted Zn-dependent peptidase